MMISRRQFVRHNLQILSRNEGVPNARARRHFEIGSKDSAATAEFYAQVFGWQFVDVGAARLIAGGNEGGPSGMLNTLGHPPDNYVMVYIHVGNLEAALERVTAAGGKKLVGPVPLPDGRRFAWVADTAGNTIGLLTPLP